VASFRLLFSVEVAHRYFDESRRGGDFTFTADPETRALLARKRCLCRSSADSLQVIYEVAGAKGPTGLNPGQPCESMALRFEVRSLDPLFSAYTDCAETDDGGTETAPRQDLVPGVVVRERPRGSRAEPSAQDPAPAIPNACPTAMFGDVAAVQGVRPIRGGIGDAHFAVQISLSRAPRDDAEAPVHQVAIDSREVTWKYLLAGAWPAEGFDVRDAAWDEPGAASDRATDFIRNEEVLAAGARAAAFRSAKPIALAYRSDRRFLLRDIREIEPAIVRRLPQANPADLIVERSGDREDLVCEIVVPF
jgi:hypothetical protein